MLLRIWRIAHLSKDMLGTYLCAGVFTMILWQVFQNVAMTIGHHAGHRPADAVHLVRRLQPGHVLRPARAGAERPHAPLPLACDVDAERAVRARCPDSSGELPVDFGETNRPTPRDTGSRVPMVRPGSRSPPPPTARGGPPDAVEPATDRTRRAGGSRHAPDRSSPGPPPERSAPAEGIPSMDDTRFEAADDPQPALDAPAPGAIQPLDGTPTPTAATPTPTRRRPATTAMTARRRRPTTTIGDPGCSPGRQEAPPRVARVARAARSPPPAVRRRRRARSSTTTTTLDDARRSMTRARSMRRSRELADGLLPASSSGEARAPRTPRAPRATVAVASRLGRPCRAARAAVGRAAVGRGRRAGARAQAADRRHPPGTAGQPRRPPPAADEPAAVASRARPVQRGGKGGQRGTAALRVRVVVQQRRRRAVRRARSAVAVARVGGVGAAARCRVPTTPTSRSIPTCSRSARAASATVGPVGRYLMCVQVRPSAHPGRRARGSQPHRALRQPAGRRRQPDPRQHLRRQGAERAARHGGGVRRHRHAEERGAVPRRRAVRRRGHRREEQQPAHRADAAGQAAHHLPGHQEPDRGQGRPPHPGGVAARAGSWCSSPTRRPTASPSACPTTCASACATSSTGSSRPSTA